MGPHWVGPWAPVDLCCVLHVSRFCVFLCVSVRCFLPKWPAQTAQVFAESCKMCQKDFMQECPLYSYPLLHVTERWPLLISFEKDAAAMASMLLILSLTWNAHVLCGVISQLHFHRLKRHAIVLHSRLRLPTLALGKRLAPEGPRE